ncbi:MAG: hypothetical protein OXH95_03400 [bacterium]|nr:hypothetical protein [bacterium]
MFAYNGRAVERLSEVSGELLKSDHVLVETLASTEHRVVYLTVTTLGDYTGPVSGFRYVDGLVVAELGRVRQISDGVWWWWT